MNHQFHRDVPLGFDNRVALHKANRNDDFLFNYLPRLTRFTDEVRAQSLMAGRERIQRLLENATVECSREPEQRRHIIERAAGFELIEKPEPLLTKGERTALLDWLPANHLAR